MMTTSRIPSHSRWAALLLAAQVGVGSADYLDGSGEAPYEPCGYCHEYDGNSLRPDTPRLAAQAPAYLRKQLEDYRAGRRHGTMTGTAETLSDADIVAVADYFGGQAPQAPRLSPQPPDQAALAERLFDDGDVSRGVPACAGCHAAAALVAGQAATPSLDGQHAAYLLQQLNQFASGERRNDAGGVMRAAVAGLTAKERQALAGYLARREPGSRFALND